MGGTYSDGTSMHQPASEWRRQSRRASLIEAIASTVIGYLIALAGQLIVFPAMGIAVTLNQNLIIGGIFMGISTLRSYVLRRGFEWLRVNKVLA